MEGPTIYNPRNVTTSSATRREKLLVCIVGNHVPISVFSLSVTYFWYRTH